MGIAPSTPLTLALSPEGERDNTTVSAPEFNAAEAGLLERYFTNLDRPVFALRNLPEVVKGALFSRYSRTEKSLRRVLLDEFINEPDSGFDRLAGQGAGPSARPPARGHADEPGPVRERPRLRVLDHQDGRARAARVPGPGDELAPGAVAGHPGLRPPGPGREIRKAGRRPDGPSARAPGAADATLPAGRAGPGWWDGAFCPPGRVRPRSGAKGGWSGAVPAFEPASRGTDKRRGCGSRRPARRPRQPAPAGAQGARARDLHI